MAKVNGPLMSLDASGTIGNAITYSKWKGRNYVRERVIPANPKSEAQTGRRAMFRFLTQAWNALSAGEKASYQDLADQLVASPFNAYISINMSRWHNFLTPTQETPAGEANNGSDNVLSAAAWEENRIKLTISGAALSEAWGIIIFAKTTASYTPSVGLAVMVELDTTIAEHFLYWTPPEVTTWYMDSVTFGDDGTQETEGGEQTAAP